MQELDGPALPGRSELPSYPGPSMMLGLLILIVRQMAEQLSTPVPALGT
jgi:hypothetical protein